MPVDKDHPENLRVLESWLKSYHPEEIWNNDGTLKDYLKEIMPKGNRRMGSNPVTNAGLVMKDLRLPDFSTYNIDVPFPGSVKKEDTRELSKYIKDVIQLNPNNFRIFGPDEALSNRLSYMFEVTNRQWMDEIIDSDEFLARDGRVIDSILSEHFDEGALEGYILTGRHGFMHSYEAFIRIVDSMVSQHAKWIKICNGLNWRKDIPSLNYLLSSHVWQQDHNGFTHQDPGFLNHLVTKKADTVRMYLPPDANCLLSCFDHCLRTKNYINVVIASKHPSRQWLTMEQAKEHCKNGIGIFEWASNDNGKPDVVLAACGDVPTLEVIAASTILRKNFPKIKVRVVNIVDLMKLQSNTQHPHGLTDEEFDKYFPPGVPVIFGFHGYPSLIHQLVYKRKQDDDFHVHGYTEEGTITTAFDMRVQNHLDRFHLVMDALRYLKDLKGKDDVFSYCNLKLTEHDKYIREYGKDLPEIDEWSFEEEIKKIEKGEK
jgi:xylulose-5-phosphate/fructose-6-phosphate phosphoketolase